MVIWAYSTGDFPFTIIHATRPELQVIVVKYSFSMAIYNFKELWKYVGGDISYKPKGDTEVLAEALSKWDSIKTWMQCNGMFSIAIFDKEHESLKIARDRTGQKPLFYVLNPIIKGKRYKGIIFASEIKAILPIIDTTIDKKFIYEYLVLGRVESSINTLYKDIKKLKPGNEMFYKLDQKEPNYNSFWNIYDKAQQIISNESILEINQKCKAYIKDSVNIKLQVIENWGSCSVVSRFNSNSFTNEKIFNRNIFSFTYDFKTQP